jgi:TIR domain
MNRTTNSIKVFVTHKSEDITSVNQFVDILRLYDAAGRLQFVVAEDMPIGENWRQYIHCNVVEANVLFFLMISPAPNWEWCIYEAGLFAGSRSQDSTNNIITFFDPSKNALPTPLEHLQAVQTNQDNVERFLRQFYGTTDLTGVEPPINRNFSGNPLAIHNAAQQICSLLANNTQSN